MNEEELWKVQLWLGDNLIEEHLAPTPLAEQYANVIRLRVEGLSNRHLKCERANAADVAYYWSHPPRP